MVAKVVRQLEKGSVLVERRRFFAGDEVRVRVKFKHRANIVRVAATFSNDAEGGRDSVNFYELTPEGRPAHLADKSALTTESEAVLYATITNEHRPDVYRCAILVAVTAGDEEVGFYRLPDLEFEVIAEPTEPPQLSGFDLADDGVDLS